MSEDSEDVDKILSQSEVGALLKLVGSEDASSLTPAELAEHAELYDFRQRSQLGPEQRALLEEALVRAAHAVAQILGRMLREPCSAKVSASSTPIAADFLAARTQTLVFVADLGRGGGKALLTLPRSFAGRAVDRMLGGAGSTPPAGHDPTRAELVLVQRLVRNLLAPIRTVLGESAALQIADSQFVKNALLPPVVDPAETLVAQSIQLTCAGEDHSLGFAVTARSLSSGRLPASRAEDGAASRPTSLDPKSPFGQLPLKVVAVLGESQISIRALLDLEVGDVLCIGGQVGAPLDIRVSGVSKFRGTPGLQGGRVVIKLTESPTPAGQSTPQAAAATP